MKSTVNLLRCLNRSKFSRLLSKGDIKRSSYLVDTPLKKPRFKILTQNSHNKLDKNKSDLVSLHSTSLEIDKLYHQLCKKSKSDPAVFESILRLHLRQADLHLQNEDLDEMKLSLVNAKYFMLQINKEDLDESCLILDQMCLLAIWAKGLEQKGFLSSNFRIFYNSMLEDTRHQYHVRLFSLFETFDTLRAPVIPHDLDKLNALFMGLLESVNDSLLVSPHKADSLSTLFPTFADAPWKMYTIDVYNNCSMMGMLLLKPDEHYDDWIMSSISESRADLSPFGNTHKRNFGTLMSQRHYLEVLFESANLLLGSAEVDLKFVLVEADYLDSLDRAISRKIDNNPLILKILFNVAYILSHSRRFADGFKALLDFLHKMGASRKRPRLSLFLEINSFLVNANSHGKVLTDMIDFLLSELTWSDEFGVLVLLEDVVMKSDWLTQKYYGQISQIIKEQNVCRKSVYPLFFLYEEDLCFEVLIN